MPGARDFSPESCNISSASCVWQGRQALQEASALGLAHLEALLWAQHALHACPDPDPHPGPDQAPAAASLPPAAHLQPRLIAFTTNMNTVQAPVCLQLL